MFKELYISIIGMRDARQPIADLHFRNKFMYYNFVSDSQRTYLYDFII